MYKNGTEHFLVIQKLPKKLRFQVCMKVNWCGATETAY